MENESERWAEIGRKVRARMQELAMNQAELIRASGVSDMTVRPIIEGEQVRSRAATLAKVARGLRWQSDAFDRMLAGDDPVPNGDESEPPPWDLLLAQMEAVTQTLERLADLVERRELD